jgi:hypothetical protein
MPRHVEVIGTVYAKPNELGDFKYMAYEDTFKHASKCILVYNENQYDGLKNNRFPMPTSPNKTCVDKPFAGGGSAGVRPLSIMYNIQAQQDSATVIGISTGWSIYSGGYKGDTLSGYKKIGFECEFEHIKAAILANPKIKYVVFSAEYIDSTLPYEERKKDNNKILGCNIFNVSDSLKAYITKQLRSLETIDFDNADIAQGIRTHEQIWEEQKHLVGYATGAFEVGQEMRAEITDFKKNYKGGNINFQLNGSNSAIYKGGGQQSVLSFRK